MVMRNKLLPVLAATLVAGATLSGVSHADQMSQEIFDETRPNGASMVLDAVVVRPVMVGATLVGGALYVAALPFTLAGGTADTVWSEIVEQPATQAFIRCLGCTPAQHERAKAERQMELAQEAAAQPQAAAKN